MQAQKGKQQDRISKLDTKGTPMKHTMNELHSRAIRLLTAVVAIGVLLSACNSGTPASTTALTDENTATPRPPATATPIPPTTAPQPDVDLPGTHWTAVTYVDDEGNTLDVLPDTVIDAEFTADQLGGTAGCNHYFAGIQIDGAGLTLGPIGATEMFCGETLNNQEMAYLKALGRTATYRIVKDQLQLVDAEGNTVVTLAEAAPPTP